MRIVLDTNLFISSLITSAVTPPGQLVDAWLDDRFDLASSETQIDEIKDVTGRPGIRTLLIPSDVGRLINQLRSNAIMVAHPRRASTPAVTRTTTSCSAWPRPAPLTTWSPATSGTC